MSECRNNSPFVEAVQPIMQGQTMTVTGRLFIGLNPVIDWTGYTVAFMVYSDSNELLFSSNQNKEGVQAVLLNDDGTITFRIPGDQTREMKGRYFIEGKIINGEEVTVSKKTFAFQVEESRIGRTDKV